MSDLFELKDETYGLEDFRAEVVKGTLNDVRPAVEEGAQRLTHRMQQALSRQARSAPGDFPGKVEGHLVRSIGWGWDEKTRADLSVKFGNVIVAVGMGCGREATMNIRASKAQGVNPFLYGYNFEHGGTGPGGRREPPRPFVRPIFEMYEAVVDQLVREAL